MATYKMKQRKSVKRIDECVRQYEAEQHEERMRKATKAIKHAKRVISEAESMMKEIDGYV